VRAGGLAELGVDTLQGPARPVRRERKLDAALVGAGVAGDPGLVAFVHFATLEGPPQRALRVQPAREHQQARCGHVQPVYHERVGELGLHLGCGAVLQAGRAAGHRGQARRFVHHDELRIGVEHAHAQAFGLHQRRAPATARSPCRRGRTNGHQGHGHGGDIARLLQC
jgi:hypothetical protein